MNPLQLGSWIGDWAWGIPLIVVTVVIHVCGLALVGERVIQTMSGSIGHRGFMPKFVMIMGRTSLEVTALHAIESGIWASSLLVLGALPESRSAMLYSLNAMTSFGHVNLFLPERWQLMGALEALNGMLLFGLTTAFLFAIIQQVWPLGKERRGDGH